jgi:hypothetical protein
MWYDMQVLSDTTQALHLVAYGPLAWIWEPLSSGISIIRKSGPSRDIHTKACMRRAKALLALGNPGMADRVLSKMGAQVGFRV